MNIQIYCGKKNFEAQKAERWFKERRIAFQSLDLKKHPLPKPDTDLDPMNSDGEYEYVYMLKDDDSSYEYIGYVCTKRDVKEYIVWSWVGYHEDGSVIGMDVYYTLEGKYLGNIQRDYSAGTSTSSHRCPYYIPGQPLNKK